MLKGSSQSAALAKAAREYDAQLLSVFKARNVTWMQYNQLILLGHRRPAMIVTLKQFGELSEYFTVVKSEKGVADKIQLIQEAPQEHGMYYQLAEC